MAYIKQIAPLTRAMNIIQNALTEGFSIGWDYEYKGRLFEDILAEAEAYLIAYTPGHSAKCTVMLLDTGEQKIRYCDGYGYEYERTGEALLPPDDYEAAAPGEAVFHTKVLNSKGIVMNLFHEKKAIEPVTE